MSQQIRFCEFTGDDKYQWDEIGHKALCQHAGFRYCQTYQKPLGTYEGWRVCCSECTIPVQVKDVE